MHKIIIKRFDNLDDYVKEIQDQKSDLAIYRDPDGSFRCCRKDGSPVECINHITLSQIVLEAVFLKEV